MKNLSSVKKITLLKMLGTLITLFVFMSLFSYTSIQFLHKRPEQMFLVFSVLIIISFVVLCFISMHSINTTTSQFYEKELFFEKICNMSNQGIFITNKFGMIEQLNIKAQSYYYEERNNIIGTSIFRNIDCNLKNSKNFNETFFNDMGTHFKAEIQIKSIKFHSEKHFILFVEDQTESIAQLDLLKKQASEDPLTGLLNRRSFLNELNKEIERSSRIGLSCSIALIDLDHFKDVNDTFGHDFGDEVLSVFANILKENSRQLDILCRFGGEEFLLLLPHTNLESTLNFLDRIKIEFADHHYTHNIKPTFSGGAINTEIKGEKTDVNLLLKEVDQLLYVAKENGRNQIKTKGLDLKLIKVS